jgi:hypothetical protein
MLRLISHKMTRAALPGGSEWTGRTWSSGPGVPDWWKGLPLAPYDVVVPFAKKVLADNPEEAAEYSQRSEDRHRRAKENGERFLDTTTIDPRVRAILAGLHDYMAVRTV